MDTMFHLKDSMLVAELCGEIDHHVCDKIREDIDKELELYEVKHLVFDFKGVTFMDSSGIGVVLGRYKKLKKNGGTVTIRSANKLVKQILDRSGIFTLMEYKEEEEEDGE